jgi:hypothetical protein
MNSHSSKKPKELSLGESLEETIANPDALDTVFSLAEIGIDEMIEHLMKDVQDEALKEIPVVKTLYAITKTGFAIRDYFLLEKICRFILGCKEVRSEIQEKITQKLSNQKDKKEIGKQIIIALDRFEQIQKTDILLKIFLAFAEEKITDKEFQSYIYVLDKIDINNIKILKIFYLLNILQKRDPVSSIHNTDAQQYAKDIKDNYFHLQNFAFLGLITLNLGSKEEKSDYNYLLRQWISSDEIHPGKFEPNRFGYKFLKIINLINE